MKRPQLSQLLGASVIAASLAVVPMSLPAAAQTGTGTTDGTGTTTTTTGTDTRTYNDDGFDWGWLGLLGLLGLAGLAGKKRHDEPTRYRDPNATVGSSTYRD